MAVFGGLGDEGGAAVLRQPPPHFAAAPPTLTVSRRPPHPTPLHPTGSPDAFDIRVRPALDSLGSATDRLKMWIYETCAEYRLPCPVTGHPPTTAASAQRQQQQQQQQPQQQPSAGAT